MTNMKYRLLIRQLVLGLSACSLCSFAAMAPPADSVPYQLIDKNGSGQVAFTFQAPAGWKVLDTLNWNLMVRSNPMVYTLTAIAPDGNTWFSYMSGLTFPYGSGVGGGPTGKPAPAKPSDFLQEYFEGANKQFSPKVLKKVDTAVPYPYKTSVLGVKTFAYHSELLGEVNLGGHIGQMKLSADYLGYRQTLGTGYVGNWTVNNITVVKAPAELLAEASKKAKEVLESERPSPGFVDTYIKVSNMLLARTKQENDQARAAKAQRIIVTNSGGGGNGGGGGGGGGGRNNRIDDRDTFTLRMAVKGLQSRIFSRSIGN